MTISVLFKQVFYLQQDYKRFVNTMQLQGQGIFLYMLYSVSVMHFVPRNSGTKQLIFLQSRNYTSIYSFIIIVMK